MTVTELALLRLKPAYKQPPPELLNILANAKAAMETFNGADSVFTILQQVEDPACLYVLGDWGSLDAHMNGFIPSDANQQLVGSAAQYLDVDRLAHYALCTHNGGPTGVGPIRGAVTVRIERHIVIKDEKDNFQRLWSAKRPIADSSITAEAVSLEGWRLEEEVLGQEHEEWTRLTGWNKIAEQLPLEGSAKEQGLAAVKDLATQVDVRHAEKLL